LNGPNFGLTSNNAAASAGSTSGNVLGLVLKKIFVLFLNLNYLQEVLDTRELRQMQIVEVLDFSMEDFQFLGKQEVTQQLQVEHFKLEI
jgi:hypothetical protein